MEHAEFPLSVFPLSISRFRGAEVSSGSIDRCYGMLIDVYRVLVRGVLGVHTIAPG